MQSTRILLGLVLACGPLIGAITRVQVKSSFAAPGSSIVITFDSNTTSGNMIIVYASSYYDDSAGTWTVSDNKSNAYSQAVAVGGSSAGRARIYYAESISGGSSHEVTLSSTVSSFYLLTIAEYSGLATSSSLDKTSGNHNSSSSSTYTSNSTATTTQAAELLAGVTHNFSTLATNTPDSGWTAISTATDGANHKHFVGERIVSSTGAYAYSGTFSTSLANVSTVIATFKEASGGASGPPQMMMRGVGP